MALKTLRPLISARADGRALKPEPKRTDPFYVSPEYRVWREAVVAKAGRRCEATDERTGQRCLKSEANGNRMFADHIRERSDGGDPLDPANGRCLCGSHHTFKTARARAHRLGSSSV